MMHRKHGCNSVWQLSLFVVSTVWPKILAGRYFGGLLKICHLAEFTLAVEPVSHNYIRSKMANRTLWEFNIALS